MGEPTGLSPVLNRATRYLEGHGVESPRRTAELLLMHVLRTDRAGLYARRDGLTSAEARAFGRALCRRCTGDPVQHITGEQQFMDLSLEVRPGVFVPRPETERLVEVALETLAPVRTPVVADAGTGTGAVALALKRRRPDARVLATDLSPESVDLAGRNADRLGLDVEVLLGDLLDPLPVTLQRRLDLVVSNPPYVSEEEYAALPRHVLADPPEALVGGTRFHRRLVEESPAWLRPRGWLVMEIGERQGAEVATIMAGRFESVEVLPDPARRDRIVRGRLAGRL